MNSIKSAERVLDLLEAFRAARGPLSLSAIAGAIGAPISSCHGLVQTLQARGYLYPVVHRRLVYPTRRLLDVALELNAHDPVLERLRPTLDAVRDATGETVILGKRQDQVAVYLAVVEGRHTVRYTASAGEHKPLHSSAIGKLMLASMHEEKLAELLARLTLPRITASTLVGRDELLTDLARTRRRGYAVTRGENVVDVMALAAPVAGMAEPLAIAVAGPLGRMEEHLAEHAAVLLAKVGTPSLQGAA
jgi:DNA-binding IclR family transcriptional regulator